MTNSPLHGYRTIAAVWECGMWCIPLLRACAGLLVSRIPAVSASLYAWLYPLLAIWITDILCAPLYLAHRAWYVRVATAAPTDGCIRYAYRHSGRAVVWRLCVLLARGGLILCALLPALAMQALCANVRGMLPLICGITALAAGIWVIAVGGIWLQKWAPMAELLADSNFVCAYTRCRRLMRGQTAAYGWFCVRGIGWRMVCGIPLCIWWAAPALRLRRALWITTRAREVLPPMRDGVRLYLPTPDNAPL